MPKESLNSYPNNKNENWVGYRDSKEFKRGLEQLENMVFLVGQAKILILAVALNLKKASEFEFQPEVISEQQVESMLSDLGVYFYKDQQSTDRFNKFLLDRGLEKDESIKYLIGVSPDALNEAIDASHSSVNVGESMEYPATAIEAFQKYDETGGKSVLPRDDTKRTDEEKAFSFFRMSVNNWEEEVKWLEQIIAGIKEYSPKIYQQVVVEYEFMEAFLRGQKSNS